MHGHVKGLPSFDSERHVWKAQWQEHRLVQPTVLPLGLVPTPALTLALSLPFFTSLSFSLHFIRISSRPQSAMLYPQSMHTPFRPALPLVNIRHTNTESCFVLWTTLRKSSHSLLPPQAENDFTHSISSASIMTVWQHGKAAASWLRWKAYWRAFRQQYRGWVMHFLKLTTDLNCVCQPSIKFLTSKKKDFALNAQY